LSYSDVLVKIEIAAQNDEHIFQIILESDKKLSQLLADLFFQRLKVVKIIVDEIGDLFKELCADANLNFELKIRDGGDF